VRRKIRWLVLAQCVGMLCLMGGAVWCILVVKHNGQTAIGIGTTQESYVFPVVLTAFGYVLAMTGFVAARRLALKHFGRASLAGWLGLWRGGRPPGMRGGPGMGGGPGMTGTPGMTDGFIGGLPPGTPGSPSGPPL